MLLVLLTGCDNRDQKGSPADKEDIKPRSEHITTATLEQVGDRETPRLQSDNMVDALNVSPPSWLKLGPPIDTIKAEEPKEMPAYSPLGIRPSGSKESVEIAGRTLQFRFPVQEIMWLSVDPSGNRVVFRRGEYFEIRNVTNGGLVSLEDGEPLPWLNFDALPNRRWFLGLWCWLSKSELLSALNRQTEEGDMIAESSLYYYNADKKRLAKVSLPDGFIDTSDPHLEITQISGRKVKLRSQNRAAWIELPAQPQ